MKKSKEQFEKYYQLRLNEASAYSYNQILSKYGVECDFIKKITKDENEKLTIGFNVGYEQDLITCFLNQGYDLISVSEDQKSITFHLVTYVDEL